MKHTIIFLSIIAAIVLLPVLALAQTPDTSPLPTATPVVDVEPAPTDEVPEFPTEPPELPDQLPEDPNDLSGLLETLILFGAGLAVKWLTDQIKWLPYLTNAQKGFVQTRIAQLGWAAASVIIAIVTPYFGLLADLARSTGIWGVILALLGVSWAAHRGDKLLRVGTKFLAARA